MKNPKGEVESPCPFVMWPCGGYILPSTLALVGQSQLSPLVQTQGQGTHALFPNRGVCNSATLLDSSADPDGEQAGSGSQGRGGRAQASQQGRLSLLCSLLQLPAPSSALHLLHTPSPSAHVTHLLCVARCQAHGSGPGRTAPSFR